MKQISVLDCTLRDGGYCNNWMFGQKNIRRIIDGVAAANVEYIECGFLTNRIEYDTNRTKFTKLDQVADFVLKGKAGRPCLVMINYGEYSAEELPECDETCIDGIRVAFHKKDAAEALRLCAAIKEKGYLVFVQPMVSVSYSEDEFVALIREVNRFKPYAFYVVDSFGVMKKNALMQLVEIADKNLSEDIALGFHAHNNLQLAFSNAQYLVDLPLDRSIIIDVSVHGMGRGAGNLNAELFLDYLNETTGADYAVRPILNLMDEIVSRFYQEKPWGYSLPNYLSASHLIHPNYATYLDNKKTLTLEAMDEIFHMMDPGRGLEYNEKYIETLYIQYLSRCKLENSSMQEICTKVQGKKVLLIAPGQSVVKQKDAVCAFIQKEKPVVISINHDYPCCDSDYIFVSNMRRFRQLSRDVYGKTIVTSNINSQETFARVEYYRLLNGVKGVRDNAGLMAIKFIAEMGGVEIYLAGFDGYSHDVYQNFETKDMALLNSVEVLDQMNDGMRQMLEVFSNEFPIHFITESTVAPSKT